ncbi:MAG: hypothetical protein IJ052_07700 [Oscillospiraceae bacterium]|jgi:hypothetical protein|nr:hypothetical protein [Oscillospiraceae bacterium]
MDKTQLLKLLEEIPWPRDQWWLTAGGAMVLYGLREQTRDIDLGCTSALADALEQAGFPIEGKDNGLRHIRYSETIELSENFSFGARTRVEGIPVLTLAGLLEQKRYLNRPKDQTDIQALERALKIQEETK